jgi:hypothetical protein
MAAENDITVRADRDFYLNCALITALGNPANLTGYQIEMTVKKVQADPDSLALYKGLPWVANLPFGQFTFHIPRAQNAGWWVITPSGSGPITSTIVYDVSCLDIAIPPNMVTLMEGSVSIIGPVTVNIP